MIWKNKDHFFDRGKINLPPLHWEHTVSQTCVQSESGLKKNLISI